MMLAVAGDSAAGKTTTTAGLVEALGPERCVSVSADDYHRFDRAERRNKPFTPLHPDCNYIEILEQHLQLLATGQPILKPVYDHSTGRRVPPELVEPKDVIIVHGLLPLYSKLTRACFDVTVFLDPPEYIRRAWKIQRDTLTRGYTREQVAAEIASAEAESTRFIRPQRAHADIVVRFAPIVTRDDPPDTPLSAELVLRPTIRQPDLTEVLQPDVARTIHLRLARDTDGRPVDTLHIHGYSTAEENAAAEKMAWEALGEPRRAAPECLGMVSPGRRSTPLAITQMILLHHLLYGAR
ncbi:phosphoribulokinase [Mycobacterium sp. SM1]|uniref:phosphoribulokinase n=1 Tax=Mycobacterium sp. SM1 TaxID=2816243 RepID=UPI001BCAB504|nr:phosphoribulokinase [Mycobacterium sp. SM1]MBS4727618.1 phosphoribulokinase [Mycobacterium sp. SM1]